MNYVIIVLLSGLVTSGLLADQETFLKANAYYKEGLFEQARDAYQSIAPKGVAAWYNLGNSYYQMSQYPQALAAWYQALTHAKLNDSARIEHNIAIAQNKLAVEEKVGSIDTVKRYVSTVSFLGLQLLVIALWYITLFLLVYSKYCRRWWLLTILGFLNCFLFFILLLRYQIMHERYAVIVQPNALLRVGPDTTFHPLQQIPVGKRIAIKEQQIAWVKVSTADGSQGWIENTMLM